MVLTVEKFLARDTQAKWHAVLDHPTARDAYRWSRKPRGNLAPITLSANIGQITFVI